MSANLSSQQSRQLLQRRHLQESQLAGQASALANAQSQNAPASQGKFGDYVFRPLPRPSSSMPGRAPQLPGQRPAGAADNAPDRDVGDTRAGAEPPKSEVKGEASRVAAIDTEQGGRGSHGGSGQEHGNPGGGGNAGGGAGAGAGAGGGSGGGGGRSGGDGGDNRQGSGSRFGASRPIRNASAALSASDMMALSGLKHLHALVVEAPTPKDREQALAYALTVLSGCRNQPGQPSVEALQQTIMGTYLKTSQGATGPATLASVKETLLRQDSISSTALRSDQQVCNRKALLPLKLLMCNMHRTESQREAAVDRLLGAQSWMGRVAPEAKRHER